MNTCAHCGKELDRKIFCNNSHRAMYYRKQKQESEENPKKPKAVKSRKGFKMPKTWTDKYES